MSELEGDIKYWVATSAGYLAAYNENHEILARIKKTYDVKDVKHIVYPEVNSYYTHQLPFSS